MTQFTPTLPTYLHQITPLSNSTCDYNNVQVPSRTKNNSWPKFQQSKALRSFGDTSCMEQLLLHCAEAIEANDVTLTQQILWVLNNTITPPDGGSNHRLATIFLRALTSRAAKILASVVPITTATTVHTHRFSATQLANFVDVTPRHRFGFTAANSAILEATEGFSTIHIVDLTSTHCMQIPTLIDAIATHRSHNHDVTPHVKLTVVTGEEPSRNFPPFLTLPYEELGSKLVNFARSKKVMMDFKVISSTHEDGFSALIQYLEVHHNNRMVTEALVINCHMMLHCIPDETASTDSSSSSSCSMRSMFLKWLRRLEPRLVVLVEDDVDMTWRDLVGRVRAAFNYMWIPYDMVDMLVQRGSEERDWYEEEICWRVENVIACDGVDRVERMEGRRRWEQRMRDAAFQGIGFSDDAVSEVKELLDEHAAAWGFKRQDPHLLLTWKGHDVVFASAWVPA